LQAFITEKRYIIKKIQFENSSEQYRKARIAAIAQLNWPAAIIFNHRHQLHKGISNAYNRGAEFMQNFDDKYRAYIGSRVSQTVQVPTGSPVCKCEVIHHQIGDTIVYAIQSLPEYTACENLPDSPELPYYIPVHNYNPENGTITINCNNHFVYDNVIEWINKDSDGVVLAESAMNIPQATWIPQRIDGSTHMALRNDKNLKDELNKVFEGEVGLFFKTAEQ